MQRNIKVIVAESNLEGYYGYESCDHYTSLSHQIIELDDLFNQGWFLDIIKEMGYIHKDELEGSLTHVNNFVFEKQDNSKYKSLVYRLEDICHYHKLSRVFQEVVGSERIKQVELWKKANKKYLDKQAAIEKANLQKKEASKEKLRLRKLEKAKKTLEEAGINVIDK